MGRTSLGSVAGLIALLVTGCATLPARDADHQTLVIGKVVRSHRGYESNMAPSVNGTASSGIDVTIKNVATSAETVIRTQAGGLFWTAQLTPGDYVLTGFTYALNDQWGKAFVSISFDAANRFIVRSGKVNNLGSLLWQCDAKHGCKYGQQDHPAVRESAAAAYPKSDWLNSEWANVAVGK